MPSLRSFALALGLLATTAAAERLRAVFSSGSFSTIGDHSDSYKGFAIVRENGEAIYNMEYPDNHSPCYNAGDGRTFKIEGDCWASPRKFHCESDFAGHPEHCAVLDGDGNELGSGEGQEDTTYIGIAIGTEASCVVELDSDDAGHCPVDDGNGILFVTEG